MGDGTIKELAHVDAGRVREDDMIVTRGKAADRVCTIRADAAAPTLHAPRELVVGTVRAVDHPDRGRADGVVAGCRSFECNVAADRSCLLKREVDVRQRSGCGRTDALGVLEVLRAVVPLLNVGTVLCPRAHVDRVVGAEPRDAVVAVPVGATPLLQVVPGAAGLRHVRHRDHHALKRTSE